MSGGVGGLPPRGAPYPAILWIEFLRYALNQLRFIFGEHDYCWMDTESTCKLLRSSFAYFNFIIFKKADILGIDS